MAADKWRRYDVDDSDHASFKKKGSSHTVLLVGLIVGGVLFVVTCAGGLAIFLVFSAHRAEQPEGSQPEVFIGSWQGRFLLHGVQRDIVYTFEPSGKWSQVEITPGGQRRGGSSGRWAFQNGQVTINFNGGTSETANAVFTDANTMDYLIVRHDERTQIGLRTTFRRE